MIVVPCTKLPASPPRFKDLCCGEVFRVKGRRESSQMYMKVVKPQADYALTAKTVYNAVELRTGELQSFDDNVCIEPVSGQFEEA